jgi:hypothetical protein
MGSGLVADAPAADVGGEAAPVTDVAGEPVVGSSALMSRDNGASVSEVGEGTAVATADSTAVTGAVADVLEGSPATPGGGAATANGSSISSIGRSGNRSVPRPRADVPDEGSAGFATRAVPIDEVPTVEASVGAAFRSDALAAPPICARDAPAAGLADFETDAREPAADPKIGTRASLPAGFAATRVAEARTPLLTSDPKAAEAPAPGSPDPGSTGPAPGPDGPDPEVPRPLAGLLEELEVLCAPLVPSVRAGPPGSDTPSRISGSSNPPGTSSGGVDSAVDPTAAPGATPVIDPAETVGPTLRTAGSTPSSAPWASKSSSDSIRPPLDARDVFEAGALAAAEVPAEVDAEVDTGPVPLGGDPFPPISNGSSTGRSKRGSRAGREAASIMFEPKSDDES